MNDVSRLHCGVMDQYSHRYFCSADQSSVKNSTRTTQFPLQMRFWPEFTQQVATKWLNNLCILKFTHWWCNYLFLCDCNNQSVNSVFERVILCGLQVQIDAVKRVFGEPAVYWEPGVVPGGCPLCFRCRCGGHRGGGGGGCGSRGGSLPGSKSLLTQPP